MGGPKGGGEESKTKAIMVARELLRSCGLKLKKLKDGSVKHVDIDSKDEDDLFSNFKPSSETQPLATPFVKPQKVTRDGMGILIPPEEDKD